MQGHVSLKRRLLVLALTAVVLMWAGAAAFVYFDARKELGEVLDAHLAQEAALLAVQASHELDELGNEHTPLLHKYARQVAFQIWENGNLLRLHSANASQQHLANVDHGFSDSTMDGHRWRVFSAWDESGKFLIHVAERADEREELARDIASNLLKPLLFSLPLLALLLWVAVARGLHPLDRLAGEVERRGPETLSPLDIEAAPHEVLPLIERLNRLFARINDTIQRERRFTADAAHELRTPVAGIKAQAQVARAATAEAERIHALDNAILGCDRATHLIEQLLTLARVDALDAGGAEPCRLKEIAAGEIALIAPAALSKGVHIELSEGSEISVRARHGEAEPSGAGVPASHLLPQSAGYAITSDLASVVGSPSRMASSSISNVPARGRPMGSPLLRSDPFALSEVRGNPELLRILMRNLIDNAVRHTLPGTTVRVGICQEPGAACLSVSDDGPGIPEQEMARVSERFYRPAGTRASGSGLGLSIVKRIAEMHDASVRFKRADNGHGLCVTVAFGGYKSEIC